METAVHVPRLVDDTTQQTRHFKEAIFHAIHSEPDMVIVSKDKQLIPCHMSLLALYSPVIGRLLAEAPCCTSPTIFLPDFVSLQIKKLLSILKFGQAIPGDNVNVDIRIISKIADGLKISMTDFSVGPFNDNPLGLSLEVKQELQEVISVTEVTEIKEEANKLDLKKEMIEVKQEELEECEYIEEDETEVFPKKELILDDFIITDENSSKTETFCNIGTKYAKNATPSEEDTSIAEELEASINLSGGINASYEVEIYKYAVKCRLCGVIRNSNLKFSKAKANVIEHLRNKHDQTENFDESFEIIHNGKNIHNSLVASIDQKELEDVRGKQDAQVEIATETEVEDVRDYSRGLFATETDVEDVRVYNRGQFKCLIDQCGELIQGLSRYMVHFNRNHYNGDLTHGPQLDRILVQYEPDNEGNIFQIENCFQFLGKCKFKGCNAILGGNGRVKSAKSVDRFGDGRYELKRKFISHYEEQHPWDPCFDQSGSVVIKTNKHFTIIMEGHVKLWPSAAVKKLKEHESKLNLKRKRSDGLKSSLIKDVNQSLTILRCNYCSKDLHKNDSLRHWRGCQPSLDVSKLIYTNIETGVTVRANEIYSYIGKCAHGQCGHYIGSLSRKVLDLRFKSHYRMNHGLFPENFNIPQHYSISTNQRQLRYNSKDTKTIKRKSLEKTENPIEEIQCGYDGTVFSTKHVLRHLNSSHPGQDLEQLQFKRLETSEVVNINQLLPDKIIGKCNYCGNFNLVNANLGFAVLKGVLLNHYRKFHGEPKDVSSCWDYLGGSDYTRESPTLSSKSPVAKKVTEGSIFGKQVIRDSFVSIEKLTREKNISVDIVPSQEGSSQNETFSQDTVAVWTALSTPAKKTLSKSKPTTPDHSTDDHRSFPSAIINCSSMATRLPWATGINSHIGKFTYEQCAHYIGSLSKKALDLHFKSLVNLST